MKTQYQSAIDVAKKMKAQDQSFQKQEAKAVLDDQKLEKMAQDLGLEKGTHWADVCREYVNKNGGSAGQAVDACGVNDSMIGVIWEVKDDMDARYGPYQTS